MVGEEESAGDDAGVGEAEEVTGVGIDAAVDSEALRQARQELLRLKEMLQSSEMRVKELAVEAQEAAMLRALLVTTESERDQALEALACLGPWPGGGRLGPADGQKDALCDREIAPAVEGRPTKNARSVEQGETVSEISGKAPQLQGSQAAGDQARAEVMRLESALDRARSAVAKLGEQNRDVRETLLASRAQAEVSERRIERLEEQLHVMAEARHLGGASDCAPAALVRLEGEDHALVLKSQAAQIQRYLMELESSKGILSRRYSELKRTSDALNGLFQGLGHLGRYATSAELDQERLLALLESVLRSAKTFQGASTGAERFHGAMLESLERLSNILLKEDPGAFGA